ncbi:MAG: phosphonate ABC transporter ATP-binding protein [Alphaproteobacteria bacterium]|nr:phosphonate ABC transporter ATP-binding protein [Alphaproteobacteria bacterium]
MTQPPAIAIDRISKTYGASTALKQVSLSIAAGEMVALIGASGSGKSTLLRHVSGLVAGDRDGTGAIRVFGEIVQSNGRVAARVRDLRGQIGFVFQQFNLVSRLSVLTNVLTGCLGAVPQWRSLVGFFTRSERRNALRALARVGMAERAHQRASTLSGGQQQRAAIARALVQKARVILADEPIASLDPESARRVMEILSTINREDGTTVVVSLHQVGFALRYCQRVVALDRGQVVFDGPAAALSQDRLRAIYGSDPDLDFTNTEPEIRQPARPVAARQPLWAGAAG